MRPRTVNEWMSMLAEAMTEGDGAEDTLDRLENATRGWIQTDEAMEAQLSLLDAAREVLELATW